MRAGPSLILLLASCVSTAPDESVADRKSRASDRYDEGDFEGAMRRYAEILRDHPDDYESMLGLGNACREVGNARYRDAGVLAAGGRASAASTCLREGGELHTAALRRFERCAEIRPNDGRPHYGAAMVQFARASGAYRTFAEDEEAETRRCAEAAIAGFESAAARMADRPNLHRCVGLMMATAGRFEEAPAHLQRYAESLERSIRAVSTWDAPGELRPERDAELGLMQQELAAVQETVTLCRERAGQEAGPPVNGVTSSAFRLLVGRDIPAASRPGADAPPSPSTWPGP